MEMATMIFWSIGILAVLAAAASVIVSLVKASGGILHMLWQRKLLHTILCAVLTLLALFLSASHLVPMAVRDAAVTEGAAAIMELEQFDEPLNFASAEEEREFVKSWTAVYAKQNRSDALQGAFYGGAGLCLAAVLIGSMGFISKKGIYLAGWKKSGQVTAEDRGESIVFYWKDAQDNRPAWICPNTAVFRQKFADYLH